MLQSANSDIGKYSVSCVFLGENIFVREGDTAIDLAQDFCRVHNIPAHYVRSNICRICCDTRFFRSDSLRYVRESRR